MKIIYSGFDTLSFAVRGAASPHALKELERYKERAVKEQADVKASIGHHKKSCLVAPTGMKGGYAFVLKIDGELGHVISLKNNLGRARWNGHIKIRALALACFGWEASIKASLGDLNRLGFCESGISLNRVDYAIDFLNSEIALTPTDFVAHARVKKAAHKIEVNSYSRGQLCESVTLGKMPGRQIIVYDKRREVIEKRKPAWFEIWGIDPKDSSMGVHRVEIRAGKSELLKYELRTFEDFKNKIHHVMNNAVHVVRYIQQAKSDQNISRRLLHPMWKHVQMHVKEQVLKNDNDVDVTRVKHVVREQKRQEYAMQVQGNLAGLSACLNTDSLHLKKSIMTYVEDLMAHVEQDEEHAFWKARARVQDRLCFLGEDS